MKLTLSKKRLRSRHCWPRELWGRPENFRQLEKRGVGISPQSRRIEGWNFKKIKNPDNLKSFRLAYDQSDVRFTPESGHVQCTSSCLLWAKSGHAAVAPEPLLFGQSRASQVFGEFLPNVLVHHLKPRSQARNRQMRFDFEELPDNITSKIFLA